MIKLKMNNSEEFNKIVSTKLHEYNRDKCQWIRENTEIKTSKRKYCNFAVYENDEFVGGAIGIIQFSWYFLEELWIDERYRRKNIGTMLMEKIENYAKENNLSGIRTETWDFQAKGFYEKVGYKVYATFEDCPPGTIDYFLNKKI